MSSWYNPLATRKPEFRFLDFSALFWKNFGQFSAVIWQIFCPKNNWKLWYLSFFRQIICTWQTFSIFWQSFGTYLERKKYLADFWNLVFVFLLNFETNFGEKLDKNQPKKCRKGEKSEFGFTCSQCMRPKNAQIISPLSCFNISTELF